MRSIFDASQRRRCGGCRRCRSYSQERRTVVACRTAFVLAIVRLATVHLERAVVLRARRVVSDAIAKLARGVLAGRRHLGSFRIKGPVQHAARTQLSTIVETWSLCCRRRELHNFNRNLRTGDSRTALVGQVFQSAILAQWTIEGTHLQRAVELRTSARAVEAVFVRKDPFAVQVVLELVIATSLCLFISF